MDPVPSPPVPQTPPTPHRFRWLPFSLALLATLILGPIFFFIYLSWATNRDWADAEAEADRLDPHWRLSELVEKQPAIADKDNAALHIIAVAAKAKKFSITDAPDYEPVFHDLPPTALLNDQQLKLLRDELTPLAKPLAEARQLKDMPQGRFPITFSDDYVGTQLPDHKSARDLADALVHHAYLLAHEKKLDEAIVSCRASLNAGRVMKDDLFLTAHLIRVRIQLMTLQTLERVLGQGTASEASLKAMQDAIAQEMNDTSWLLAMRGERAGGHMLFDNVRTGKVKSFSLRFFQQDSSPTEKVSDWIAENIPSTVLRHYPEHLRLTTECVEIAKLPIHEQRPKISAWEEKAKESRNPIVRLLTPALALVYQVDCRSQAHLRTALVALACERYRLRHKDNAWPATLDDLVKEKLLDALPTDPIDGKPLRFKRNKDNIVIYSIGLDGVDNGGHIDRDPAADINGLDLGFRLWNSEQRAGPPRPKVALPPAQPGPGGAP